VSGPVAVVLAHALSLSIPSTDGLRGAQLLYEHWLPERRLALGVSASFRETAAGDYTALRPGAGVGARHFWRAAGSPQGWFYGAGVHVTTTFTRDDIDDEWLGTALSAGIATEFGYRWIAWRELAITPSVGLEAHTDFDASGRLAPRMIAGFTVGLEVGWRFRPSAPPLLLVPLFPFPRPSALCPWP